MRTFSTAPSTRNARPVSRRHFLAGAVAVSAGVALYADKIGRHELEVRQISMRLRRLPPAFAGYRVVQFSDIHLEEFTEDWFLQKVIAQVNGLAADLVVITGDFISRGPGSAEVSLKAAHRCAQLLSGLTCKLRYGIMGNHDGVIGEAAMAGIMADAGVPLLINQHVRLERGGSHLYLSGLDTWSNGTPDLNKAIPEAPEAPVIAMVHEPDFIDIMTGHPRGKRIGLVLSGHTHGGQVRLPGLPPLELPPLGKRYAHGLYQVAGLQLYVNRGIGTVGIPMRLNCAPEITVFHLQPAGAEVSVVVPD